MTEKQRRVFEFIRGYYARNKVMPTIKEIATTFGYSVSTVHEYLKKLTEKGYLIKKNYGWYEIRSQFLSHQIPFYGEIAAGRPIEIWEEPIDYIDVPIFVDCENCIALQIRGNSMIEDGILNGDIIIIEPMPDIYYSGQTAVVLIDNEEATIKKIYKRGNEIELRPANYEMDSIFYPAERVRIIGKIKHLIRNY